MTIDGRDRRIGERRGWKGLKPSQLAAVYWGRGKGKTKVYLSLHSGSPALRGPGKRQRRDEPWGNIWSDSLMGVSGDQLETSERSHLTPPHPTDLGWPRPAAAWSRIWVPDQRLRSGSGSEMAESQPPDHQGPVSSDKTLGCQLWRNEFIHRDGK